MLALLPLTYTSLKMSQNCRAKVGYSSKRASNSTKSATRRKEKKTKPTKVKVSRYKEEMTLLNAIEAEKAEKERQVAFQEGMDTLVWFRKLEADRTMHSNKVELDLSQQPSADEDEEVDAT